MDNSPMGICLYASPSIENVLGYSAHEVVGATFQFFLHPDDLESARKFRVHMNEPENISVIENIPPSDSRYIKIRCRCKPIINPSGFVDLFVLCFQLANVLISVVSTYSSDIKKEIECNTVAKFHYEVKGNELNTINSISKMSNKILSANAQPFHWPEISSSQYSAGTFLVVNRFSEQPIILFANNDCCSILLTEAKDLMGHNLLNYISKKMKSRFMKALTYVKITRGMAHLVLEWIGVDLLQLDVKFTIVDTRDGVVLILKRLSPLDPISASSNK